MNYSFGSESEEEERFYHRHRVSEDKIEREVFKLNKKVQKRKLWSHPSLTKNEYNTLLALFERSNKK